MDPKQCLQIIQKAVSGFQIRSFRPIRDGWDFFVLEVNGEWMFRFPRRPKGIAQLKREAAFLEKASPHLPVSVPRYERICWDSEPPFGGYRKVTGLSLSDAPNIPTDVFADLGCFLSALHSLPPEGVFPSDSVERADWVALWQRRVRLWEERVLRELDPFLESAVRGLVPPVAGNPGFLFGPSDSHTRGSERRSRSDSVRSPVRSDRLGRCVFG